MKPWGPLEWLLGKVPIGQALVVGCVAAEDRCVAVLRAFRQKGALVNGMLRIQDGPSEFRERVEAKTDANREILRRVGVGEERRVDLMADDAAIAHVFGEILDGSNGQRTLVLDISCMPKRFFFLILKLAFRERRFETVFVAYTQPEAGRYTSEHLAENPGPVDPLPGYSPLGREPDMLVVGLGFEPLGVRQPIDEYRDRKRRIEVLIPFPPGQPYSRRIWRALQRLDLGELDRRVHRVNALDAFGTYAKIGKMAATGAASIPPSLAPYGPKPMSLGMCLYALRENAPVFYTQPTVYHPDYTCGIGNSWGYCLKYQNRRFF